MSERCLLDRGDAQAGVETTVGVGASHLYCLLGESTSTNHLLVFRNVCAMHLHQSQVVPGWSDAHTHTCSLHATANSPSCYADAPRFYSSCCGEMLQRVAVMAQWENVALGESRHVNRLDKRYCGVDSK